MIFTSFVRTGLARPGQVEKGLRAEECPKHLYQMHVCLPSKKGHTRLLYRMALDFMPWVQYVPFIDNVWQQMANQVRNFAYFLGMFPLCLHAGL